jgi:VanZ family protein
VPDSTDNMPLADLAPAIKPSVIARYSAALLVLLVVYASLYPFSGWRDQGGSPWAFMAAPWPKYWTGADVVLNVLGYIPVGMLFVAAQWPVSRGIKVFMTVMLAASALSLSMETLQTFLPERVASNVDWALNTLGATLGAALALLILPRLPAANALYALRKRWFTADASFGLWLLVLWPLALLTPQPVLLGTGDALASLASWASGQMQGSTVFSSVAVWLAGWQPAGLSEPQQQAVPLLGMLCTGLLVLSLVTAHASTRLRMGMVLVMTTTGCAATALSYAMSYGPLHAWQWLRWPHVIPLAIGAALCLCAVRLPRRWCVALALLCTLVMLSLVNQAKDDLYFMLTLKSWQQGRFIRLHGLAQWVAMLWPWVLGAYLLRRLVASDTLNNSAAAAT